MFRPIRFAVLLAGVTLAFAAWAQPASEGGEQGDPPSRVARLSYIHGDVSFVPAGENDWVQAQLNRPLVTGDKLYTDNNSRAALEIGAASIRMDQQTNFDFLNLDDNNAQMELTEGSLNLRVRRLYDGQSYEVDTPTLAFVVNRVGEFRIDVLPDGRATVVSVLSGGGDVYGEGGARFRVEEGQSVTFNDAQLQDYAVADLPQPDGFDDFCHERDHRVDTSVSRRYVSEEVIGYQDLDEYGGWEDAPEYGHVWYPTSVAVGWSPYHYGHWGWVGVYGWTWIDDAPWGFAPFHYGRWVSVGGRWGWCPGRIDVRPVYAPALVAFVGGSIGGVNISIGVGEPIGWFPLGFGEPYIPSYRVSRNYFTNVNVSNTVINNTVINNYYGSYSAGNVNYNQITYANRNVAGAVTAVPVSAFVASKPVATSAVAVNRETFANARVNGFAAVAPTRASLAPQVAARAMPAAAVVNRPIVAASRPPAPIAPFAARQAVLTKNPGQPLPTTQLHATAAAGATATPATRPNLKVVTQGAPVHTEAPKLPPKAAATTAAGGTAHPVGRPASTFKTPATTQTTSPTASATIQNVHAPTQTQTGQAGGANIRGPQNPTVTRGAAKTVTGGATTGGQNQTHVDSARFAHPSSGNESKAAGNAVSTPHATTNAGPANNAMATDQDKHNKGPRTEYRTPTQTPTPTRQYHAPTQTQTQQVQTQTQHPVQEYRKPQTQAQEYHKPQTQTQTQQYHAPVQTQQEYHAPVTTQQQQQHVPAVQAQPRYTPPPPPQQQQQHQDKKKKDKDDKNGGGR